MNRTLLVAVPELLNALPGVEELRTHGTPTWKVHGKSFAYWSVNHHDDGRVALWLSAPPGAQSDLVALDPEVYFVPPYVGPKGWLGMDLGRGPRWDEVKARVVEAWSHSALTVLANAGPGPLDVAPPDSEMRPADLNPMLGERAQAVLSGLAERCRRLPEAQPEDERASATWRANRRPFVRGHFNEGRLQLMFWVGPEQQALLSDDPRFSLPLYYASTGWIDLDVHDDLHWPEVESLLEGSYRHVALKRMLAALDQGAR